MCGIGGFFNKSRDAEIHPAKITAAIQSLNKRGPDGNGCYQDKGIALVHTRLSIIDVSDSSAQPMADSTGRYAFVYNGELFNYREIREELRQAGETFFSQGDAEVVFKWFLHKGHEGLKKLNGFFAFALYDKTNHTLWLARDAMGEKPLYVGTTNTGAVYFGSHLRTLYELGMPWQLNKEVCHLYFHLNYIPAPFTAVEGVQKMMPGTCWCFSSSSVKEFHYTETDKKKNGQLTQDGSSLNHVLRQAVARRMVSDVPVAAFLSGGIDSSIVCALAKEVNPHVQVFSAGFPGSTVFDESQQAAATAKKLQLQHSIISLNEENMMESVTQMLSSPDEPFADSSAIALHALCAQLKGKYKVVLSGDGADELFAGYNKHRAEWRLRNKGMGNTAKLAAGVLSMMPKNRHSRLGNLSRKLEKLKKGEQLSGVERYWHWAGHSQSGFGDILSATPNEQVFEMKKILLHEIRLADDMEHVLLNDVQLVLTNDMLYKTDYFGMLNAVEIRSPFLDPEVVKLALSIPATYKLDEKSGKKILRTIFKNDIPPEVFTRPKHGFEVPLRLWLTGSLRPTLETLTHTQTLESTGVFDMVKVNELKRKLNSKNPGDAHATCWAIMVFVSFYNSYKWARA
ncbi:MAG: asparagine synthase (glutamine-hydrolyzing) [Flavobacteriales bacterium]